MTTPFPLTQQEFDQLQDRPSSPADAPTFAQVAERRFGRRALLRGMLAGTALAAVGPALPGGVLGSGEASAQAAAGGAVPGGAGFGFAEVAKGVDGKHHVAAGYDADILVRWGDPLFKDAPKFDPHKQTAAAQLKQFGYNNDFLGFLPLPESGKGGDRGLLWANHEYTSTEVMFPGLTPPNADRPDPSLITKEICEVEMAAHGGSIVEVRRGKDGKWATVVDSPFNRRINALDTVFELTGPAAGHKRMQTKADPTGRKVIGMVNNCAGGVTPWGTVLTCEENIDGYFMGKVDQSHPEQRNHDRMTVPSARYLWAKFDERFDVNKEPYEPNRFGWVVEVDPYDPKSTPRKHTALGRFKHEGANAVISKDGRVVVYSGDDQRFEHVYRFISKNRFKEGDRAANMRLLEEGTLYAARYDEDGTVTWLPLVHGQGPLTAANGFKDQGDVLINARIAATLLGATRMDRPEDVEPNPRTGKVYVILTNNEDRAPVRPGYPAAAQVNAANPRPANGHGHIIEMTPPDGDHTAGTFRWEILLKAGDPAKPDQGASFNPATTENGWFSCPDNCAFDRQGRFWVATDQGNKWDRLTGMADGFFAVETEGPNRGTSRRFFRAPVGAEVCGPWFTEDGTTLFLAVQHPGVDGCEKFTKSGNGSTFEDPGTRWPDFDPKMPPRPSVVVITKQGGGPIGA